MSFLTAMVGGYVKETNAIARDRAKKEREDELLADEFQRSIDLAKEQSKIETAQQKGVIDYRIQKETDQAVDTWNRESSKREREGFLAGFNALTEDQKETYLSTKTGRDTYTKFMGMDFGSDFSSLANTMADLDETFAVGTVRFRNPSKDLSTANVYNRGYGTLENIDQQLGNTEFFNDVLEKAKGDQVTRDSLVGILTRAEQQLIEGYGILQTQKEVTPGKVYTTSIDNFTNIARLHEALNSQPEREAAQTETAGKIANTPEGFTPLIFTVSTDEFGTKQGLVRNISIGDQNLVAEMASKHGLTPQQFVDSFAGLRDIPTVAQFEGDIYMDMSEEEIVDEQYSMFNNVLEMQRRGYGEILNNPLAASPEKKQEIAAFLKEKYGNDRFRMSVALGYMLPTDQMFLAAPQTGMFYTPETKKTGKQVSGRSFLKNQLDYTDAQIQEAIDGFEYSKQTVVMLTQLKDLELGVLKDSQGFARELKRVLLGAGTQLKQAGGVLKDVFAGNDIFKGNYKDGATNSESLTAVAQKLIDDGVFELEKGSTLADISEADALKLALAARMARAIDPSGRLSNQDFEIQLRRLGGALLGDAESVKRQLNLLLTEFNGNIRRNAVIATAASVGAKIDATTARAIRADRMLETTFVGFSTDTYQPRQAPAAAAAAKASPTSEVNLENYIALTDGDGNETGMFARIGGSGPDIVNADGEDMTAAYMGTDNTAEQGAN
jgi:hypothetical protein